MTKVFLVMRKADNRAPVGDGIDAWLGVAASSDAAVTAAKAASAAGEDDGAWDDATVVDLGDNSLTAGAAFFKQMKPGTAFAA